MNLKVVHCLCERQSVMFGHVCFCFPCQERSCFFPRRSWPNWNKQKSKEQSHSMSTAEGLLHCRYLCPTKFRCLRNVPILVSHSQPQYTTVIQYEVDCWPFNLVKPNSHLNSCFLRSSFSSGTPWMNPADQNTAGRPPVALSPLWAC